MTERPILFSGPMVRAVLADEKTQTRRAIKPALPVDFDGPLTFGRGNRTIVDRWGEEQPGPEAWGAWSPEGDVGRVCPYGGPGDRLWVREAWRVNASLDGLRPAVLSRAERVHYESDGSPHYRIGVTPRFGRYRPPMFMPRWASRLTLEVVSVRPERVQEISDADVRAEGVTPEAVRALWEGARRKRREEAAAVLLATTGLGFRLADNALMVDDVPLSLLWRIAWILINGRESWDRNDRLWAIEFRRLR